jgi:hypothetical protein
MAVCSFGITEMLFAFSEKALLFLQLKNPRKKRALRIDRSLSIGLGTVVESAPVGTT